MKRSKFSSGDSNSSSGSSSLSSSSSSDEETDAKDLKLIKEYIPNRKELAAQLFKSVKQEKIRMMLPQILKKVELDDLQELCASELVGMSKSRILSVLNGKEMLQSSNTEDSDDSGPSLEIISDAEWLSSDETNIKVEDNSKSKIIKKNNKKPNNEQHESKAKLKGKSKLGKDGKLNAKVKLEKVKTETKEKEGETLLDLLELEMRARAIRALIRKEDSSSTNAQSKNANNSTNLAKNIDNKNSNTRQDNLKDQLEKIDILMKHGDDEDVFVVIHPAPTIELISSESDTEDNSKRINQKLVNERDSTNVKEAHPPNKNDNREACKEQKINKDISLNNDQNVNKEKNKSEKLKEIGKQTENSNLPISVTENNENDNSENTNQLSNEADLEEGEIVDNEDVEKTEAKNNSPSQRKIKKIKKNPHIRTKKNDKETSSKLELGKEEVLKKEISYSGSEKINKTTDSSVKLDEAIEIIESPVRKNDTESILTINKGKEDNISKIDLFDDKALDIDEIINLDDYPDDMDDLETNKEIKKASKEGELSIANETNTTNTDSCTETWASRYYQQDGVQNVIKESKMQSEIRKRLRERQRQNKLNNSPKIHDDLVLKSSPESIIKPTGSVEEYLALKTSSNQTNSQVCDNDLALSNKNVITEKSNHSEKNDAKPENSKHSSISDTDCQNPIAIIKKAKLIENVVVATKIDLSLNENIENDNIHTDNSKSFINQKNSSSNNLKTTILLQEQASENKKVLLTQSLINNPKENNLYLADEKATKPQIDTSSNDKRTDNEIIKGSKKSNENIDLSSLQKTISRLRDSIPNTKDNSREDATTCRKKSPKESTEKDFSEQMKQIVQSDPKSELRPD